METVIKEDIGLLNKYQGKAIGSILRKGQILLAKRSNKHQILAK